jgi:hypothetical protein
MDATEINGTMKTKLWKSKPNFGSPNKTLEEFFFKIISCSGAEGPLYSRDSRQV